MASGYINQLHPAHNADLHANGAVRFKSHWLRLRGRALMGANSLCASQTPFFCVLMAYQFSCIGLVLDTLI